MGTAPNFRYDESRVGFVLLLKLIRIVIRLIIPKIHVLAELLTQNSSSITPSVTKQTGSMQQNNTISVHANSFDYS